MLASWVSDRTEVETSRKRKRSDEEEKIDEPNRPKKPRKEFPDPVPEPTASRKRKHSQKKSDEPEAKNARKEFVCQHCGKDFTRKDSMRIHQRSNPECLIIQGIPSPNIGRKGYCHTCGRRATFGIMAKKALHCKEHKAENEGDVKNPRCEFKDCKTQPTFGIDGQRARHCAEHKGQDEGDVKNPRCEFKNCKTHPIFGIEFNKPLHCFDHAEDGETNVWNKRCSIEGCKTRAMVDGFCTLCHPDYKPSMANASKVGCVFLDTLASEVCRHSGASMMHIHYDRKTDEASGREHRVINTRYHADGYLKRDECKQTLPFPIGEAGLVIEFLGNLWHGHPDPDRHDEITTRGARVGDLYEQTMERMRIVKAQGYTVVYIWEDDFVEYQRSSSRSLLSVCHVL